MKELNQDIMYILEDISEDLNLSKGIVKIIYLVYVDSNNKGQLNLKNLNFVKKVTVKKVIEELQTRLLQVL